LIGLIHEEELPRFSWGVLLTGIYDKLGPNQFSATASRNVAAPPNAVELELACEHTPRVRQTVQDCTCRTVQGYGDSLVADL